MLGLKKDATHERKTEQSKTAEAAALADMRQQLVKDETERTALTHPRDAQALARTLQVLETGLQQATQAQHMVLTQANQEKLAAFSRGQGLQLNNLHTHITGMQDRLRQGTERLLARQHQEEQRVVNRPEPVCSQLAEHHRRQQEAMVRTVEVAKDALRALEDKQTADMRQAREEIKQGVMAPNREHNLDVTIQRQQAQRKDLDQQARGLKNYLNRTMSDIQVQVTPERLNAFRNASGLTRDRVSDEALQRIIREGARVRNNAEKPEVARQSAVKGQLFEEILRAQQERELATNADKALRFIAGDRIRDANGRKLTDGILARYDENTQRLHVIKVFEAKAGEEAAKGLTEHIAKLTKVFQEETQRYARDLAREDLAAGKALGRDLQALTQEYYKELLSPQVQTEAGQLERTIERLHETTEGPTRLFIDGRAETLTVNQGRAQVLGVVPQGVANKAKAQELEITEEELRKAAQAIAEELARNTVA